MITLTPREKAILAHLADHATTRVSPGGAKDAADLSSRTRDGQTASTSTRYTLLHRLIKADLVTIGELHAGARRLTLTTAGRALVIVLDQPVRVAAALDTIDVIARVLMDRDDRFIDTFDHGDPDTAELIYEMKRWLGGMRGIRAMEIRNAILGTTDVATLGTEAGR